MPTYEYTCPICGSHFEHFQNITAEPLKICPLCGKEGVQRLISSGAGLIFKGTGFYKTDYSATHTKSEKSATEAGKKSAPPSETLTK